MTYYLLHIFQDIIGIYFSEDHPKKSHLVQVTCAICLLFFVLFFPQRSFAEEVLSESLETENAFEAGHEWRISADSVTSLEDGLILEATGNVIVSSGDNYLRADFARFFSSTNWVFLKGNVVAKLGADEASASEAEFDLTNNTGWLIDANIFMAGPHVYFSGERLIKHTGDRYTFQRATVTACDGDNPLWSVSAEEANIERDGYASLVSPIFEVKNVGIAGLPRATIPIKSSRQTGLLMPFFGQSSFHGFYYTQPFYWAIDQSRDMTFRLAVMQHTGLMPSVEYRSHTNDTDKNWISATVLYDFDVVLFDRDDPINDKDGYIRENHFRYWLRGMTQGEILSSNWFYKANLDYVSDQNFLHEIRSLDFGFEDSRSDAYDFFGRDFAELDKNRVSEGFVYRDWSRFRVAAGLKYQQNPALGNGNAPISSDSSLHQLPSIDVFLQQGSLLEGFPINISGSASLAYMYRHSGIRGLRTELYPKISIPIDLSVASLLLSVGARTTLYQGTRGVGEEFIKNPVDWEDNILRFMPEIEATLYTQASRVWGLNSDVPNMLGESRNVAMRHTIQPRMEYAWSPFTKQENNPYFTPEDRLSSQNNITLTIDNIFALRKETLLESPTGPKVSTSYANVAELSFSTGFDFKENERKNYLNQYPSQPIHDLKVSFSVYPYSWLSFWTESFISAYDLSFTGTDTGLTLSNSRWGSWSISYSRRTDMYNYREIVRRENFSPSDFGGNISVLSNDVYLRLSPAWAVYARDRTDINTGISYEHGIGVRYQHQCFGFSLEYSKVAQEVRFLFGLEFLGLSF